MLQAHDLGRVRLRGGVEKGEADGVLHEMESFEMRPHKMHEIQSGIYAAGVVGVYGV
jgi:hypothetical protein